MTKVYFVRFILNSNKATQIDVEAPSAQLAIVIAADILGLNTTCDGNIQGIEVREKVNEKASP